MTASLQKLAGNFAKAVAQGNWPKALEACDGLVVIMPDHAGVLYNRALVLKELGRHEERIDNLTQALTHDPGHSNARFELACAQMDKGLFQEAAAGFAAHLENQPGDADARLNLGQCLLRLGRAGEALEHLKAARAKTGSPDVIAALATALRETGDLDGCEAVLDDLGPGPENAALRLKVMTQGARGRFALRPCQPRAAR
ncbi:tetratricopeptide repeat protein [Zhengella sp. ZM62]|uniref:tetratricopeptide repeat protein n=1 Tax=Zhengella sedimenti TaxID=3390035 RepID=UPI0039757A72